MNSRVLLATCSFTFERDSCGPAKLFVYVIRLDVAVCAKAWGGAEFVGSPLALCLIFDGATRWEWPETLCLAQTMSRTHSPMAFYSSTWSDDVRASSSERGDIQSLLTSGRLSARDNDARVLDDGLRNMFSVSATEVMPLSAMSCGSSCEDCLLF